MNQEYDKREPAPNERRKRRWTRRQGSRSTLRNRSSAAYSGPLAWWPRLMPCFSHWTSPTIWVVPD